MSSPVEIAPVGIGVAGLGRSGVFHIERIGLRDDCRVVAVYDDCSTARGRAGTTTATAYESWAEFLGNDEIEVALLATPPAFHAEQAIAALAAGKHVVIETPMCLNLAEADAIIAASRRTGRSVSVAHMRRWDDDYRTAKSLLAAGELGRPLAIKYINWHYNPAHKNNGPAGANSRPSTLRVADLVPGHWRDHSSTGGGVLWEFGIHYFDQLAQLVGRPAESVYGRVFPSSAGAPDDSFLAIVNFSGGPVAHIEVSRVAAAPVSTGWTIAGDAGSFAGFTQFAPNPDGEVVDLPLSPVSGEADEFYALLARYLRGGGPNPVPPSAARLPIALVEAVRRSAKCGQAVPVET